MYQAQLLSAAIEVALAKLLSFDDDSSKLLAPLVSKQCIIQLHELPFPLVFSFSENAVAVSSAEQHSEHKVSPKLTHDQCSIDLSLFIINEIKDTSNITRLIRDGKLDFDGNLQIAQNMSALFNGINIDIEEVLSQYVGDIAAHTTMQQVHKFKRFAKHNHQLAMGALSDALLDEKRIAVRPIMVENYIQEVNELRDSTDRMEARVALLEKASSRKLNTKKGE
ncbi:SCP2 sterol-binding domain-containing protein [Glaciecola sp. MH2013]|uniref:ubiquinone biosynthesis accessory factor UbiJ n=1 Tax=Glaciecola sp. MH2013 TaxID=2785524 RepID=UPI00189DA6F9|nr:SCP2 sterol-binding domain-containing protein [Glaciecola sp. MH2013]MBF7073927.1 SCP2 sterol-binding domain-containing protein [Glaciecola sp. MH2013]